MAYRTRSSLIRYGGEKIGTSDSGDLYAPSFVGEHFLYDETHPGPPYNSGGPFLLKKKYVFLKRFGSNYAYYHSTLGWYNGSMGVRPYIPSPEPQPTSLVGWGAKGWSRTQPLHPIYNLGVSIGELKDLHGMVNQTMQGMRSLRSFGKALASGGTPVSDFLKSGRSLPSSVGDAYLYGAFGLYPMLQDLLFLMKMREKLQKKIAWLRRKNGKTTHARIELDNWEYSEDIARVIAPSSSVYPVLSQYLYADGQNVAEPLPVLKSYQRRIWYEAKYLFHIPELDAKHGFDINTPPGGLSRDLLGLNADPSIIYKLIPWSWLLDWFSSVGAVMSNIYAREVYHVVAKYAYVMCEEHLTYDAPGHVEMHSGTLTNFAWPPGTVHYSGVSSTVYKFKQREEANPYGFGVTFASLSSYQWSILTALGLSRRGSHSAPRA